MSTPRKSVSAALLTLTLAAGSAVSAAQAAPVRSGQPANRAAISVSVRGLLTSLWSYVIGTTTTTDPRAPKPTQGPSVDPNGGGL